MAACTLTTLALALAAPSPRLTPRTPSRIQLSVLSTAEAPATPFEDWAESVRMPRLGLALLVRAACSAYRPLRSSQPYLSSQDFDPHPC